MAKEYYIITWELCQDNYNPWEAKAKMHENVDNVLSDVRNMELGKEKGRVDNIVIRKFEPRTGRMVDVEPFLNRWEVGLREVSIPIKPPLSATYDGVDRDEHPQE